MNYFSKHKYSQQFAHRQMLLLETAISRQSSRDTRFQGNTARNIMPLPANSQQLIRWIEDLPQEIIETHPHVHLLRIHILLLTQQFEQAAHYLEATERTLSHWECSEQESIKAEIRMLRAYLEMHQEVRSRYHKTIRGLVPMIISAEVEQEEVFDGAASEHPMEKEFDLLSKRELEVLNCIAAGMSNREIAQTIVVTVGTVKRHMNNIYSKLDVHSRIQAIKYAQNHNLLSI